jgi:single-strand DNA-binding protein
MSNFNFNKVILGGRLTNDIELKQTTSSISVCSFSLAINRKVGKDQEPKTDFIDCQAWRQTAEFLSRYFKKGSSLCIVGSLQKSEWTDQNGQKRYKVEVVVDEALFVDSKNEAQGTETAGVADYAAASFNGGVTPKFEAVNTDDDLPF